MNLELTTEETAGETKVFASGEIDTYTAPQLREMLETLTSKQQKVTVDLSDVNYIDSTGLGVFVGALKASQKHGSSLLIVGLNDRVKRLFSITGLNEVMDIEEERREAK